MPIIRPALPSDRAAIVEFCRGTWGPGTEDYIERVIDDWLSREDGLLAVAEVDGRAAACSYVRLLSPREAFLAGMRVDPAHRRGGLALALTEYCARYAAARGRPVARVIIGWNNAAALAAIQRAGFERSAAMTLWERPVEDPPPAGSDVRATAPPAPLPAWPPGALWAIGWMVRELTADDVAERARAGLARFHAGGFALLRHAEEHLWLAWLSGDAGARAALAAAALAAARAAGLPRCRALLASDPAADEALGASGWSRGLEYHVYQRRAP